jgi:hypothetical protein
MQHVIILFLMLGLAAGCGANVIRSGLFNSNSVMLQPSAEFTIYVQTGNISENQEVSLASLAPRLSSKGYKVVSDPGAAYYWLQARIVYCHNAKDGVTAETVAKTGFGSGIGSGGSPILTATGGNDPQPDMNAMMAKVMAMSGNSTPGMASQPPPEGILYLCVADVQITERGKGRAKTAKPAAGHGGVDSEFRMRTVAHVLQKRLNIKEATPIIQEKLNTGIAGMF